MTTPEHEATAAAQALASGVDGLREDVQNLARTMAAETRSAHRWRWLTVLLCALALVTFGLVVAVAVNVHYSTHQAACVRQWANAYAARTNTLTQPAADRAQKLDDLIRTLPATGQETQKERVAAFQSKLFAYLQASDKYQSLVQTNPPPIAPQFTC